MVRPIFSHETQAGEFDVLSSSRSGITVHDCRIEADCRHLFISHHSFAFDRVFDGRTSSEAVYADAVAPLVRLAAHGEAPACIMMYGQTGSGKTYTMRAIHQLMTRELSPTAGDIALVAATRPVVFLRWSGCDCGPSVDGSRVSCSPLTVCVNEWGSLGVKVSDAVAWFSNPNFVVTGFAG